MPPGRTGNVSGTYYGLELTPEEEALLYGDPAAAPPPPATAQASEQYYAPAPPPPAESYNPQAVAYNAEPYVATPSQASYNYEPYSSPSPQLTDTSNPSVEPGYSAPPSERYDDYTAISQATSPNWQSISPQVNDNAYALSPAEARDPYSSGGEYGAGLTIPPHERNASGLDNIQSSPSLNQRRKSGTGGQGTLRVNEWQPNLGPLQITSNSVSWDGNFWDTLTGRPPSPATPVGSGPDPLGPPGPVAPTMTGELPPPASSVRRSTPDPKGAPGPMPLSTQNAGWDAVPTNSGAPGIWSAFTNSVGSILPTLAGERGATATDRVRAMNVRAAQNDVGSMIQRLLKNGESPSLPALPTEDAPVPPPGTPLVNADFMLPILGLDPGDPLSDTLLPNDRGNAALKAVGDTVMNNPRAPLNWDAAEPNVMSEKAIAKNGARLGPQAAYSPPANARDLGPVGIAPSTTAPVAAPPSGDPAGIRFAPSPPSWQDQLTSNFDFLLPYLGVEPGAPLSDTLLPNDANIEAAKRILNPDTPEYTVTGTSDRTPNTTSSANRTGGRTAGQNISEANPLRVPVQGTPTQRPLQPGYDWRSDGGQVLPSTTNATRMRGAGNPRPPSLIDQITGAGGQVVEKAREVTSNAGSGIAAANQVRQPATTPTTPPGDRSRNRSTTGGTTASNMLMSAPGREGFTDVHGTRGGDPALQELKSVLQGDGTLDANGNISTQGMTDFKTLGWVDSNGRWTDKANTDGAVDGDKIGSAANALHLRPKGTAAPKTVPEYDPAADPNATTPSTNTTTYNNSGYDSSYSGKKKSNWVDYGSGGGGDYGRSYSRGGGGGGYSSGGGFGGDMAAALAFLGDDFMGGRFKDMMNGGGSGDMSWESFLEDMDGDGEFSASEIKAAKRKAKVRKGSRSRRTKTPSTSGRSANFEANGAIRKDILERVEGMTPKTGTKGKKKKGS